MSEKAYAITVSEENHEVADNNLCKAQAILQVLQTAAKDPATSNAVWAAFDLIEEARELYTKY